MLNIRLFVFMCVQLPQIGVRSESFDIGADSHLDGDKLMLKILHRLSGLNEDCNFAMQLSPEQKANIGAWHPN